MSSTTISSQPPPTVDDELDSTIILAIVIGSTGFVLMMLGAVYYLTRLGDVPSRKRAVANSPPAPTANQKDYEEMKDLEKGGDNTEESVREELIEIYAPAGKLGVLLEDSPTPASPPTDDSDNNDRATSAAVTSVGPPLVHNVRETSVLKNELQVGDRIIALDDEDVRTMTANQVSKMISRKKEQATRKLSILRTMAATPAATDIENV